ncbi:hypothetical protein LGT39_08020 [Demequina sp. TTPB684]|uniref:hypothetical protein n=1 Tax=unclassified Demequina TaxID=2620311 RepID=UPI001CF32ADB|nr:MULTISPECIES: hypothetical protein [unclassified Demequina]MCB2412790.1 hypothetical protein [Demequina sp. TTPB684]UPU87137.1 hypothetical protein LGT36_007555 [Demequina sp. TMPB413]
MKSAFKGVSEYDRFGPWIDDVTEPEEVPRLYRSFPIDFEVERQVLKVPRNITRRNATPDMDLYDHLILLGPERLTVLSRRKGQGTVEEHGEVRDDGGKGFDIAVVPYVDIVAIRDSLNLLDGRLYVATADGIPVRVRYNGSAADVVAGLVGTLKDAASGKEASRVGSALLAAGGPLARPAITRGPGRVDTFLASAFLEAHSDNPRLSAWAAHGRRRVPPVAAGSRGSLERLKHALSPMTLHGALFAADEEALEIFGRHSWLVRGRGAIYSTAHLVIPFGAPDRLELARHPLYPEVTVATIGAGEWKTTLPVPRDSVAEQLLSEAASRVG